MDRTLEIGTDVQTDLFLGRDGQPSRGRVEGYTEAHGVYAVRWDDTDRIGYCEPGYLAVIQ